jgi:radical SAM protein with 4Fe4S-binding SPASM domain
MSIYTLFQRNKFFYNLGRIYIESDFREGFEQSFFKIRNVLWGSPPSFFHDICLETISGCNRRCSYCPNKEHYRGNHLMPIELIHKIIDDLADLGFKGKICPHFYGEPLMDKRLPEIISYIRKKLKKSKITVYSNGDFLTTDLFEELIKRGVNMFEITQHDKEISENMKKLFDFLEKNPKYKNYLSYRTKLFFDNRGGLLDIKETVKREKCFFDSLVIDYKGNVVLCCNDFLSEYSFGNLSHEKIIDVWNKPSFKKIRKECSVGVFNLKICKKCINAEV